MLLEARPLTVEEFDALVFLPEHRDRHLEYIGGRIVEVVSNDISSETAANFMLAIGIFVKANQLGRLTGADGGYEVSGERYIPDVAFISKARQPYPTGKAYNPLAPDLAIEVLSPANDADDMRVKIVNYLRAGVTVWVANPERKQVQVFAPDTAPLVLGIDDVIDGGNVLPGFRLPVKDVFPPTAPPESA
jgi:Uma2 family endonuclease